MNGKGAAVASIQGNRIYCTEPAVAHNGYLSFCEGKKYQELSDTQE